jgi:ribonucleoside-diphosphate reductase alpha chain
LQLGKELGNAPWIHKTKWPSGWLPIDTYNKNVDSVVENELQYDWEELRREIISNGGIRNSVTTAHMPSESSSKASATTNGLYPIRDLSMLKTDNNIVINWCAPDSDKIGKRYELAWDIASRDMIDCYAIVQKFTDQGISSDLYRKIVGDEVVGSKEMLSDYFYMTKMGLKTRYYVNSKTSDGTDLNASEDTCGGGGCTL